MKKHLGIVTLSSPHSGLVDLQTYYNKPIVVFNSASLCGFTHQLKDFQDLYASGKIVPMALPTNEFGKQEPGNQTEIFQHYNTKYGVEFPVLQKTTLENDFFSQFGKPDWNFNKYLFDAKHNFIDRFDSNFKPLDLLDHV